MVSSLTGSVDDLDKATLKAASSRGLAVSFAAQITRFAVQFLSSVLMARLLLPSEFGLVAMAAPVIAFVQLFADLGLTQATVQRPSISQVELSFIFWVGLAASVILGGLVMVTAPLAAAFYHEPRVAGIVLALGAVIMMSGGYAQHNALLNRSMRFGSLAIIDLGSYATGALLGILAALTGWSYWSIVIAQATTSLLSLVLAWVLTRWVPSRPRRPESARALLGFGGNVTTFNFVNYFARNLDNILIGRFTGEVELGLYDRAYKLLLLPLSQITGPIAKVANPLLARTFSEPALYRRSYFRMLETVLLLTYPGVIFAGIHHFSLITIVLGPQWSGAAPIFGVLAIGALFAPISNSTGWLFTTQDRTREMRNYGAVSSFAFILSFVAGLHWGAFGVACFYIATGSVQGPAIWWAATRRGPVTFIGLMKALMPYLVAGALTIVVNLLVLVTASNPVVTLIVMLPVSYLVFIAGLLATHGGRVALKDVLEQVKSLRQRVG